MNNIFYILHILAAVALMGPVSVAVTTFQSKARAAHDGNMTASGAAVLLHRITKTYGALSLLVPLLGIGVLIAEPFYLKEGRFHASIALSVIAWALLFFGIIPWQKRLAAAVSIPLGADESAAHDGDEAQSTGNVTEPSPAQVERLAKTLTIMGWSFCGIWIVIAALMVIGS